ncbi:DUF4783 domain-containing protein [Sphingobacterium spiritivorum]|uniref:DUF4783 domain-containing protein n=1 Tax=Sphingobacterium spiritivorum TaxID=258 RepID=UPI003DA69964
MKKWIIMATVVLSFLSSFARGWGQDIAENILSSLRAGNSKDLAKNFASTVSVAVKQEDGVYSKFQAELILNEFFRQNKPSSARIMQKMNSNSSNAYYVFSLKTQREQYRVFTKLIENNDVLYISEIRFEPVPVK